MSTAIITATISSKIKGTSVSGTFRFGPSRLQKSKRMVVGREWNNQIKLPGTIFARQRRQMIFRMQVGHATYSRLLIHQNMNRQ
jgi:hypothetical protein